MYIINIGRLHVVYPPAYEKKNTFHSLLCRFSHYAHSAHDHSANRNSDISWCIPSKRQIFHIVIRIHLFCSHYRPIRSVLVEGKTLCVVKIALLSNCLISPNTKCTRNNFELFSSLLSLFHISFSRFLLSTISLYLIFVHSFSVNFVYPNLFSNSVFLL